MASTRRLAAILAADVAGYARLMGADDEGTHERLQAHLRHLINPKIEEHRGRIVKNTGDGVLAEFASVVDAVRSAVEVQRGMIDRDPDVPEERRITFRIGVNLGDVIVEEHDIFGDGVNVAARLEALAEPGGICVSGIVRDQVRGKLPYALEDLGEQSLKNIEQPVRVYALRPAAIADLPASTVSITARRRGRASAFAPIAAVALAALIIAISAWWLWPATKPSSSPAAAGTTSIAQPLVAPRLSIVVLPFTNLSNDPEQQYFADGITEDLTTNLSRLPDMFVISRNSAFTYRDKPLDTKQIGRELGVRYVLEGSVQRSGSRVRVNTQLINAETDAHLWADRFDSDASDLFALQDQITRQIAIALNVEVITAEAARPAQNPDALDYVLRGRAALYRPISQENYAEAINLFEHALELDPQSADAQLGLAQALVGRVLDFGPSSPADDIKRAETLANRALVAAPRTPLAHSVKGGVLRAQRRCAEAILEYETALSLDHNAVGALAAIGRCKIYIGPIEDAIPMLEQAIRLGPRDPYIGYWYFRIGETHLLQSHIDEAILWFEKAKRAFPAWAGVRGYLASAYALKGDGEHAAAELAEARKLGGEGSWQSIARLRAGTRYEAPGVRALVEATFYEGLRKAGMPEE
jgi:TolB-like protein/class 3 adenylate cyclase/Flp pilus assembly protein TadD